MIKLLFLLAGCFYLHAHDHIPQERNLGTLALHELSIVKLEESTSYLLSYRTLPSWDGQVWDQTSIKARYRLFNWLKVRANYVWQKGARHNIDWVSNSGDWIWANTSDRVEKLSQIEIIPRWMFKNAIMEWRQTFSYNDFIEGTKWITRFGANFYDLNFFDSKLNLMTQAEYHLPFNEKEAIETWVYILPLFKAGKHFRVGPQLGWANFKWSSTDDFKDSQGESYTSNESFTFAGIRVLASF